MIVTSATPTELVNWFHSRQDTQRVLCVLLAPSKGDQQKITDLVDDLYATDAVLGEEVAFLLLHPGANTPLGLDKGYGGFATLRGTAFPGSSRNRELAYSLRDAEVFRDMSSDVGIYRQQIAEKSSRAMALFVPEFMKLFSVAVTDLPALCVVIKGLNESAALPLGSAWTVKNLVSMLAMIRAAADQLPDFQHEFQSLADAVPAKLQPVSEVVREIEAKTSKIIVILDRLIQRHHGTESDRTLLSDYVARGCPGQAELQISLDRVSFRNASRFLRDGQVTKVLALAGRLESLRSELDDDLSSRRYVLTVADRARQLVERRAQLLKAIQGLGHARFTLTSDSSSEALRKVGAVINGVKMAVDLGEKLVTGLSWLRKLVG
ncbi:hypothetical protein ACI2S5_02915 [Ralstonia nicotianae]